MLSFEAFCHRKDDPSSALEALLSAEGFVQLPEEYENLFLNGSSCYEGSASFNGFNFLDAKNNPQTIEEFGGCKIIAPRREEKAEADNASLSNALEAYSKTRGLSLPDTLFLQKVCLSLNAKLSQKSEYVYLNLKDCENAPLLIDVLGRFFGDYDLLFSLPQNLKFIMPVLSENAPQRNQEEEDRSITLGDGYRAFFDDVCGIAAPDFVTFTKKTKKKKPQPKQAPAKKAAPSNGPSTNLGTKMDEKVRKDVLGNLAFSFLFALLSIAAPYFYFNLLNEAASVYFAIYMILDVFFLVMSAVTICYLKEMKAKMTKGWYWFSMVIMPIFIVLANAVFYLIAKQSGWLGAQCYSFLGLGFGYIVIYPLTHLLYPVIRRRKRKAKA